MVMIPQKLHEGAEKETLVDNDRIATAIEGQEGASWISFLNLFTQIKNAIVGLFANKPTLDKLGDTGGALTYNGQPVANTAASGSSTEVQFRNTETGALDSDPLFKYDKAAGVLIAGDTIKFDKDNLKIEIGSNRDIENNGNYSISIGETQGGAGGESSVRVGQLSSATGSNSLAIGSSSVADSTMAVAIGASSSALGFASIAIGAGVSEQNSKGISIGLSNFFKGNTDEKWAKFNAAQLIRAFEITSIAPVATGTVTAGTANTLTDSTKTYVLNQYTNFVVEKTTVGGEKEQRVIISNIVAGQLTVRDNWTVNPVAGDAFKIITATIITADNLGSIYRFNLSSGYDHALILPAVTDIFNRAFCEFYIEGHSGAAVLHKFPASGQLIQGQPKTEMVADREMVRLISHAQSIYHWDVESTVGLDAYVSATAATQSVVAPNTTFTPITTAVTVLRSKRFQPVNIGGQVWIKYTSSLGRSMQVGVGAAVINRSTPATVITVGVRIYKASTATTTDYTLVGSAEQLSTTGQLRNFILADIFELESGDRLQVIHKASNNNNYDITASLQIR